MTDDRKTSRASAPRQRGTEERRNGIAVECPFCGEGEMCRPVEVVEVDERFARQAGRLCATADQATDGVDQARIDDIDLLVAAVADEHNEPVLTRNVEDFETLGVDVRCSPECNGILQSLNKV